jgi:hypothetical protein
MPTAEMHGQSNVNLIHRAVIHAVVGQLCPMAPGTILIGESHHNVRA